ncbi:hypothetical protein CCYA_CCYA04G1172 [Cyanidiococcus yangmingshanensis]|nr:hypothetical protein CCYA_CCYA04G1172 [Cyanidiococcus yangmingshanensis]
MLRLDPERTNELNFREIMQQRGDGAPPEATAGDTADTTAAPALPTADTATILTNDKPAEGFLDASKALAEPSQVTGLEERALSLEESEKGAVTSGTTATGPLLSASSGGGGGSGAPLKTPADELRISNREIVPEQRKRRRRRRPNSTVRGNYESDDSIYDYDSDFIDDSEITEDYAASGKPGFGVLSSFLGPRWSRDQALSAADSKAHSALEDGSAASRVLGVTRANDDDSEEWDWSRRQPRPHLPAPIEAAAQRLEERIRDVYGEKKPNGWDRIPELADLFASLCEQAVEARWASLPSSDEPMLYRFREELFCRLSFLRTTRPKLLQIASARHWRQIERETEERLRDIREQLNAAVEQATSTEGTSTSTSFWTPALIEAVHEYFITQIKALVAANFRYKKPRSVSKMIKVFATDLKQHPVFVNQSAVTAKDLESVYRKREADLVAERRAKREEERQRKREEKMKAKEQQAALSSDVDVGGSPTPAESQLSGSAQRSPYTQQQSSASPTIGKSFVDGSPFRETPNRHEDQDVHRQATAGPAPQEVASAEKRRAHTLEERFVELRQWRHETNEWNTTHPYPSVISQKDGFRSVRLWVKAQRMAARGTGRGKLAPETFFRRCIEELDIDLLYGIDASFTTDASAVHESPLDWSNRAQKPAVPALKPLTKSCLESEIFAPPDRFRIPDDLAEEAAREAAAAAAAAAKDSTTFSSALKAPAQILGSSSAPLANTPQALPAENKPEAASTDPSPDR